MQLKIKQGHAIITTPVVNIEGSNLGKETFIFSVFGTFIQVFRRAIPQTLS